MAGARFHMDFGPLQRAAQGLLDAMENRQALMEAIGEAMVSSTIERFEQGVDPDGKKWEPSGRAWREGLAVTARKAAKRSPARAAKAESGKFGQTLVDSGRLKGSIAYEASLDRVMWGSNVEYAAIHQYGGKAGRGRKITIPKRPYLGINDDDAAEIAHMLKEYLDQARHG